MKKIVLLIIICMLMGTDVYSDADGRITDARSYWLYETGTQQVLAEYRSNMETPAASLTKLMTCLLTLEAVDRGFLAWDETIKLPSAYVNPGGSTMALKPGQRVTIKRLVEGLMIVSANDAAEVLANRIGKNQEGFVAMMNKRGEELGLSHTRFLNANGLPTVNGQNMTSAADIGRLSEHMIKTYANRLLEITSIKNMEIAPGKLPLPSTNSLMLSRKNVDGLKTGHTNDAGYCLAATMPFKSRSDARLIAVVMGTANEGARDNAAKALLDWAENHYDFVKLIDEKKTVDVGNWRGLLSRPVSAHPEKSIERFMKRELLTESRLAVVLPDQLPIHKGDVIGSVEVALPSGEQLSVPLISDTEILSITFKEKMRLFLDTVGAWWSSLVAS